MKLINLFKSKDNLDGGSITVGLWNVTVTVANDQCPLRHFIDGQMRCEYLMNQSSKPVDSLCHYENCVFTKHG